MDDTYEWGGELRLERIKEFHADQVFKEFSDPRIYYFIPSNPPSSLEALEAMFRKFEKGTSPDGTQIWLNWLVSNNEKGTYIAWLQSTISGKTAEISYVVFPSYWKMGYGFRSVNLMIEFLKANYTLERIRAIMSTSNTASISLATKVGMNLVDTVQNGDELSSGISSEFIYEMVLQ